MKSEKTGFYRILRLTTVYDSFQRIIGSKEKSQWYISQYIRPFNGARILDIGAGTGSVAKHLGDVFYLGIEPNLIYVADFNNRNQSVTRCLVAGTTYTVPVEDNAFDIVIISGVLHHVPDEESKSILGYAHKALKLGGRVVLVDPVLHEGQGTLSRFFVLRDRGKHIRGAGAYRSLFSELKLKLQFEVRTDLLRLPYSHILTTGTKV